MSFFFARKRPTGRNSALFVGGSAAVAPHNKSMLTRLGCSACPLDKVDICTPKMSPTITRGAVYVLGEAPKDEQAVKPLTGPSGRLFRECVPDGEECSFDNVINCYPGDRAPTPHEIACCHPRKIKHIEEAKPRLILGLGIAPLQAIMGTSDMVGMRGRCFAIKVGGHSCWFLPTYNPSFILEKARDKNKPLNSMFGHCFRMDVKKAFELARSLKPPIIDSEADVRANIQCFDGTKGTDFERVMKLLREAKKAPVKAIDLETKGLRPWAADAVIMTAAVSFGDTNFSFAIQHPKSGWGTALKPILELFRELIADDTIKVAHNAVFEIVWLIKEFGPEVVNHASWQCSQMQAHFLDERKGQRFSDDSHASKYQALDFLVKQYFGISFKPLFKLDKKDMSKADLGEILIYNGADTKYGLRLYNLQNRLLDDRGLLDAYLDSVPRQPTVALIQHIGVPVNQNVCKIGQKTLELEVKELEAKINASSVVQQFVKDHKEFNWASQPDVLVLFKDYLNCPEVKITDKSGNKRLSVDKNILDKIDHPLAKLIVQVRNRAKLKSTYIDELKLPDGKCIFPDGRVHANLNTTFTETGRTSSDEVNLQNFPKRGADVWVRSQIVPPPGHLLVAVDYGQLEACTGAMCSKDKYLVKALWEDYDTHAEWARKTAFKEPALIGGKAYLADKVVMKKFRSLIKNKLVFPSFFGASNQSVRGYLHNATGFDIEQHLVDELMDEFWSTFAGMAAWQKRTMKRYYDIGYVETLCGRRHHYPLTKNQAVNMPIQGSAAELVCDAMNRLSYIAATTGKWYLHPVMNIHDDLTVFLPDDDKIFNEAIEIIAHEMLVFDYSWVNVPLSIEISVGKNWAEVQPLMKLWSHKEFGFPNVRK